MFGKETANNEFLEFPGTTYVECFCEIKHCDWLRPLGVKQRDYLVKTHETAVLEL